MLVAVGGSLGDGVCFTARVEGARVVGPGLLDGGQEVLLELVGRRYSLATVDLLLLSARSLLGVWRWGFFLSSILQSRGCGGGGGGFEERGGGSVGAAITEAALLVQGLKR